jgi:hypothetical protein
MILTSLLDDAAAFFQPTIASIWSQADLTSIMMGMMHSRIKPSMGRVSPPDCSERVGKQLAIIVGVPLHQFVSTIGDLGTSQLSHIHPRA